MKWRKLNMFNRQIWENVDKTICLIGAINIVPHGTCLQQRIQGQVFNR